MYLYTVALTLTNTASPEIVSQGQERDRWYQGWTWRRSIMNN